MAWKYVFDKFFANRDYKDSNNWKTTNYCELPILYIFHPEILS